MLKWVQTCPSSLSLGFPSHSASLHFIDCIGLNIPIDQNLKHQKKPFFIQTFKASWVSLLITLHWLSSPTAADLFLIFRVSLKRKMWPKVYPHSVQSLFNSFFWELLHRGIADASKLLQNALNATSEGYGINPWKDPPGSAQRNGTLLGALSLQRRLNANIHI